MSGALIVFAKRPEPGRVKTRMCPPFSQQQAAAFYAELLHDVLEVSLRAARRLELAGVLAVDPESACAEFRTLAPDMQVVAQRGPDLSSRMEAALSSVHRSHGGPLLLRGSDSPLLEEATLAEALDSLGRYDLVLCPDLDGGYNLVGLNAPAPGLFAHPMSTASVLQDTLAQARRIGLHASLMAPGMDIDVVEDLHLLARAREEGRCGSCPRTLAWLDGNGLWPAPAAG